MQKYKGAKKFYIIKLSNLAKLELESLKGVQISQIAELSNLKCCFDEQELLNGVQSIQSYTDIADCRGQTEQMN